MKKDIIWEGGFDNNTYYATVSRDNDNEGTLDVYEGATPSGDPVYSARVGLSYGAMFGPDVADVNDWIKKVLDFIDRDC